MHEQLVSDVNFHANLCIVRVDGVKHKDMLSGGVEFQVFQLTMCAISSWQKNVVEFELNLPTSS